MSVSPPDKTIYEMKYEYLGVLPVKVRAEMCVPDSVTS